MALEITSTRSPMTARSYQMLYAVNQAHARFGNGDFASVLAIFKEEKKLDFDKKLSVDLTAYNATPILARLTEQEYLAQSFAGTDPTYDLTPAGSLILEVLTAANVNPHTVVFQTTNKDNEVYKSLVVLGALLVLEKTSPEQDRTAWAIADITGMSTSTARIGMLDLAQTPPPDCLKDVGHIVTITPSPLVIRFYPARADGKNPVAVENSDAISLFTKNDDWMAAVLPPEGESWENAALPIPKFEDENVDEILKGVQAEAPRAPRFQPGDVLVQRPMEIHRACTEEGCPYCAPPPANEGYSDEEKDAIRLASLKHPDAISKKAVAEVYDEEDEENDDSWYGIPECLQERFWCRARAMNMTLLDYLRALDKALIEKAKTAFLP